MANPIYQKIIKNAVFNLNRFGETITYMPQNADEGNEIVAIV